MFTDKQNPHQTIARLKPLSWFIQSKNRKRREIKMKRLRKRAKGLAKLASHQTDGAVEITLPYVALGDLRRRWRQRETPLHSTLLRKVCKFERIKIPKINLSTSQDRTEVCWYMEWH